MKSITMLLSLILRIINPLANETKKEKAGTVLSVAAIILGAALAIIQVFAPVPGESVNLPAPVVTISPVAGPQVVVEPEMAVKPLAVENPAEVAPAVPVVIPEVVK